MDAPKLNLVDLLSPEIIGKLQTDGDYILFNNGWLFNSNGRLGVVLNLPVERVESVYFGSLSVNALEVQ